MLTTSKLFSTHGGLRRWRDSRAYPLKQKKKTRARNPTSHASYSHESVNSILVSGSFWVESRSCYQSIINNWRKTLGKAKPVYDLVKKLTGQKAIWREKSPGLWTRLVISQPSGVGSGGLEGTWVSHFPQRQVPFRLSLAVKYFVIIQNISLFLPTPAALETPLGNLCSLASCRVPLPFYLGCPSLTPPQTGWV